MAAFFSAAAHAPVTAILILFEMTGDYRIILPLMLATVVSTLIVRAISHDSIYTLKLTRRGINLEQGHDIDVMQGVTVGEAMNTDAETLPMDLPLKELVDRFAHTHNHGFPVVDASNNLIGVVSIRDLEQAMSEGSMDGKVVADIATTKGLLVCYPNEPMWKALRLMGPRDVSQLPVLQKEGSNYVVGLLRRRDIVQAYNHAISKKAHDQHQVECLRVSKLDDADFIHLTIPPDAPCAGQRISELELPEACLIVSVRRGRKLMVPHGYTKLRQEDRLTVIADNDCLPIVEKRLTGRHNAERLWEL
jgi:CIC family chloride channel protein